MSSSGRLLRLGLLLLLAALLLPLLAHVQREVSEDPLELWADRLLSGALLCLGIAVVLAMLEKAGVRVAGQRCKDCGKPVPHGKMYCQDDFRRRIEAAREKYHGQRGMGV